MVAGARTFSLEDTFLPSHVLNPPPTRHALLAFLLALAAVLHVGTAAWGDLYDGVEGRVAGGAREMLTSRQWVVPRNNGVPQIQTPPLASWAVALSYKIFGVHPAAARLPMALAMMGSVALTFLIGERLAGYWRGFAAGLIFLCSTGTFVLGRLIAPDNLLALFIAAAMYCAVCGYQRRKFRRAWFAGFWLAAALATLAKGPGALLLLGGTVAVVSIYFREARLRFAGLLHWANLLLFLAVVAPWFIWTRNQLPEVAAQLLAGASEGARPAPLLSLLFLSAWWFPMLFLVLPGIIFAPRKIFRPNESAMGDALPLAWIGVGLLTELLIGDRRAGGFMATGPAFALFAACAWERTSRPLRVAGVAVTLVLGIMAASSVWFAPPAIEKFLGRSLSDTAWFSIRPLAQIAIAALLVSTLAALFLVRQRGEVMLVLALAGMVPAGFCLIESGSRAAPFLSLADVARYLNPRLGRAGEVVYEGPPKSATSLTFYLDKKFFLLNQRPSAFEHDPSSQAKYLDEHFLLETWARSDPIYLIVDEDRVSYWRDLIVQRVHIYHQVTRCGRRVVLSNQL
jgi:4-amino-4-deoxy-L-arabinose transferase-like glycosyltransferase